MGHTERFSTLDSTSPAQPRLYPLRFEPILQERIWGGRHLADWLDISLPGDGPIGEAWVLSDRADHPSRVSAGALKGHTLAQLVSASPSQMLGRMATQFRRFPLLLKFLDVDAMLSVQVHPADRETDLIPAGETGKTEAWVVLKASPGARVYAGLRAGVTAANLSGLSAHTLDQCLASFTPVTGQGILIEAGTVHATGDGVLVFEVQQNSDVTFRLYDWDHIDPKTGRPRALQVEQALACVNPGQGAVQGVVPRVEMMHPVRRERLFDTRYFRLWRIEGSTPFPVGAADEPRIVVSIGGTGNIEFEGVDFPVGRGAVMLLPAAIGACCFRPAEPVTLLEIAIPDPA